MNLIDIHQLLALKAIKLGDESYSLRVIFRWYSKTFHVPLPEVDDIPLEDVLQAYFESRYEELEEEELERAVHEATMSDEQKAQALLDKEADKAGDEDFLKEAEAEAGRALGSVANAIGKLGKVLESLPPPPQEESVPDIKLEPEVVFEFNDPEPFI